MKPTSAPAGSALARLFEAKREIRALKKEIEKLTTEKPPEKPPEKPTEKPTEKPPESSGVCLVCGGDELDWHWPMTGEGDEVWHRVTCQDCNANWQDVYTFSGIDNLKKGND